MAKKRIKHIYYYILSLLDQSMFPIVVFNHSNSNKSLTALFLQYIFYSSIVLHSKSSKYLVFYGRGTSF